MKQQVPGPALCRLFIRACFSIFLVALFSVSGPRAEAAEPIRLLNSVEFRGPIKDLPKWSRVLSAEKGDPTFVASRIVSSSTKWSELAAGWKNLPYEEQLKAVNTYFNQWPYRLDPELWGVPDYWETPREFLQKSGDCEDYSIAKYYALRALGVPADKLRIVVVINTFRNQAHAVLAAYTNNDVLILDNMSNLILSHTQAGHYRPQLSVNENYRWAHVPVKK